MAYLLDTDILSLTRRHQNHPQFGSWLQTVHDNDLFISAMTIGEIEKGIEKQRSINPDFAAALQTWLEMILNVYSDRLLAVTPAIARRWGRLAQQLGHANVDLLIASTALEHGLVVVTRNTSDFDPTGVSVLNPFA